MTKWDAIMNHIHGECRGGPVLGPHLEAMAITRFATTASTMTARLRELRDCGFLTQESGRIGASSKRYVAYTCNRLQWHEWMNGGPDVLRAFLKEKRQGRKPTRSTCIGAGEGSTTSAEGPGQQLMLADAAEPKRHWEHG